ncbi:MAG TPA: 6,7-dimethyl-8-ribityllumazine synthase [Saprospiraceae bacterium]|nr:6,7-dimethyl-8-ribityllumazine synthase [Saprospiraceae bacterium]
MASKHGPSAPPHLPDGKPYKFGIVVSKWNEDITNELLFGAKTILESAGVIPENLEVLFVPGSFELPWGARQLMKADKKDAIICLGCIVQGETKHDEYIANAVATGIMQLSLASGVPVLFGVLTTNSYEQARDRAGGTCGNKGCEAATAALELAQIKSGDKSSKKKIGF